MEKQIVYYNAQHMGIWDIYMYIIWVYPNLWKSMENMMQITRPGKHTKNELENHHAING